MDVAVVTGAGRGLGRAFASRLARRGLDVLVTDIDHESAQRSADAIGPAAWAAPLDVRDPAACRAIAAAARERGRLAVWVNSAGVLRTGQTWEQTDEDVELLVAANVLGVVHGSRAAIQAMRANGGGRLLNMASLSSLGPAPGLAVYGATKHAVLAYSTSLQAELREAGIPIEVRSLCPDAVETDMVRERASDREAALLWSSRRLLTVDEVADRGIELLYGDRLSEVVPRYRGVIARAAYLSPRLGFRLHPLFKRLGERNRRRWRGAAGA